MIEKRRNKNYKEKTFKETNSSKNTVVWIYNPAKNWDFWFVDLEAENKGYFVFSFNKKDALPWDKVEAEVKEFKWKDEAVVLRVLERSNNVFIWQFKAVKKKKENWSNKKQDFRWKNKFKWKNDRDFTFWFVIVNDNRFSKDIFISWKNLKNVQDWDIVWVKILKFDSKSPEGEIVEVIWKDWDIWLDVNSFIVEAWFKQRFPLKIDYDLKYITDNISHEELNKRKDLRNLFTFTIDGEDAKDLDDAISIKQRQNGNYELYVHIADVTHYVREWSNLDKEAIKRWTSVYLTDRVIPMLPVKLSNQLCSLNPDSPKLTLTCEMLIWKDGQIKKSKVYESIIQSDYRLTYKEVDQIVWKEKIKELFCKKEISEELVSSIEQAEQLRAYIEKNKEIVWVLNFDFPETKIIVDDNKNVVEIKEYTRYNSNKMIEEFMISANYAVWKEFSDLPFLHRIHPKPNEDDLFKLQNILNLFWVKFDFKNYSTKEFSDLLLLVSKNKNKKVLEKMVLRSLSKAIYSNKNEWHFGLGLDFYSHFTSPIRRYPDLQIHRIIKEKISKKLDKKRIWHYEFILKEIADKASNQERKAEKLEYKVRDYFIVKYYKNKVWEEFIWNISWLLEKWIFVQLEDTAEWFIELKGKQWFVYNEELMNFIDRDNKKTYTLWDKVNVKLIEADLSSLRLNFEFV